MKLDFEPSEVTQDYTSGRLVIHDEVIGYPRARAFQVLDMWQGIDRQGNLDRLW